MPVFKDRDSIYAICSCRSPEHQLQFSMYDDGWLSIYIHLHKFAFLKRLGIAIRYLFGYTSKSGCFYDICLEPEDTKKISDYLLERTINEIHPS